MAVSASFRPLALLALILSSACGPGTGTNQNEQTNTFTNPIDMELDGKVVLEAKIRQWTDSQLTVDYSLSNNSDVDLVVLDESRSVQIDLTSNGAVRLFRGKQDTGDTAFYEAPTIEGRSVPTGERVTGGGSRAVPLRLDYGFDTIDTDITSIQFCLGYGRAEELEPTQTEAGFYSLNTDLNLQRMECITLQKNTSESTEGSPSLDDDHWRATLDGVLEVADDIAMHQVLAGVDSMYLAYKDPPILSCGEGYFSISDVGTEDRGLGFTAQNCTIGNKTMNGAGRRFTTVNELGNEVTTTTFTDFTVEIESLRIHVFSGVVEFFNNYPNSVRKWRDLNYEVMEDGETRTVSHLDADDSRLSGVVLDRNLSTSFTVSAPWTLGLPIVVTNKASLRGLPVGTIPEFTGGQLLIHASQKEQLVLDVNSGHGETALVSLYENDNLTQVFVPWSVLFGDY